MTRIRTDGIIREYPYDPCHLCSLQDGAFYRARRGHDIGGGAAVGAHGGEGAGIWGEGGGGD